MARLKVNSPEEIEVFRIFLDPVKHPIAYNAKLEELVESGMSKDEAISFLSKSSFEMEVYYSKNQGLFLVESEAFESTDIHNPYDGTKMINHEVS